MIRSVISDMGKVVLWFDNWIFFKKIAAHCACLPENVREHTHKDNELIRLFDTGKITPQEFYESVVSRLGAKIGYEDFVSAYCDVFSLNPPVLDVFRKLKPHYPLLLLSNTDVLRFGFIREKFPEIMIFEDYILSFEVGVMKPQPLIYQAALEKARFSPSECLFIDDMEENVRAAESLGMKTVLYRPETDLEKALRDLDLVF